jgi:enediyne biosynthesis protein E4
MRPRPPWGFGVWAAAFLAAGCSGPPPATGPEGPTGNPWFQDVTREVGLDFVHNAGPTDKFFLPGVMGSGAALFDFDGDGLLDVYLLGNAGPGSGVRNRLFRQLPDGHFQDVSAGSGLDVDGYNLGVAIGDVNNDGLPDVLVTQYLGVKLFLNRGGGKFEDVTDQAGLANPAWATSAAFFDYDRDGWLDLVVVNYLDYDASWPCPGTNGAADYCAPMSFPGRVARLFRNRGRPDGEAKGAGVAFEDVTLASGLGSLPGPGLGVLCADFDGDGWPDVFVANDAHANYLWINHHDGTFTEEGVSRGVALNGAGIPQGNMGVAYGDVDGDGLADLYVTHLTTEGNVLWRQGPRGVYRDRTAAAGLANPRWRGTGFGTVLADFDQDGSLDLAVVNGAVHREPRNQNPALGPHWGWYAQRNQLFANDGQGRFRDLSPANPDLCGTPAVGRGLARGVTRPGGAVDLLVTSAAGPARLFRNTAPGRGHWLVVRALDPAHGGRDAYGAEVVLQAGGRTQRRLINPADSYLCSSDPRTHFGLGASERVESVTVLWPDGRRETFPGGPADRLLEVRQGEGSPAGP